MIFAMGVIAGLAIAVIVAIVITVERSDSEF